MVYLLVYHRTTLSRMPDRSFFGGHTKHKQIIGLNELFCHAMKTNNRKRNCYISTIICFKDDGNHHDEYKNEEERSP